MDLINRDKLLEEIGKLPIVWEYGEGIEACYKIIEDAPIVEERKSGKWIIVIDVYCKCPFCNDVEVKFSNYCPNCGAKLEV